MNFRAFNTKYDNSTAILLGYRVARRRGAATQRIGAWRHGGACERAGSSALFEPALMAITGLLRRRASPPEEFILIKIQLTPCHVTEFLKHCSQFLQLLVLI